MINWYIDIEKELKTVRMDIKENQVYKQNSYIWTVKMRDNKLMLFSDSDGFNRWAIIDKDNMKGLELISEV